MAKGALETREIKVGCFGWRTHGITAGKGKHRKRKSEGMQALPGRPLTRIVEHHGPSKACIPETSHNTPALVWTTRSVDSPG